MLIKVLERGPASITPCASFKFLFQITESHRRGLRDREISRLSYSRSRVWVEQLMLDDPGVFAIVRDNLYPPGYFGIVIYEKGNMSSVWV